MDKIKGLEKELEGKKLQVQGVLNACHNSSKRTYKRLGQFALFSLGTAIVFFNLCDLLDGTSLVLSCIPTATCALVSGAMCLASVKNTDNLYGKLHELDCEAFDLNLEITKAKKEKIKQNYYNKINNELVDNKTIDNFAVSYQDEIVENDYSISDSPVKILKKRL